MKHALCLCLFVFASFSVDAEETNSIIVCENSLEMFGWDLEFIRHAQHSIDISPCFFGGCIARELLTEIEARMEECPTLQVKVLTTPIHLEDEDYVIINRLRTKYPDNFQLVHATNVTIVWPDVTGIDNHVKMCVVDEHYFSMGGTNLETSHCTNGAYTPPKKNDKTNTIANGVSAGTRDQDIVGRGPMAKELRKTFCKLFALWHHYNTTNIFERNPNAFEDNPFYFEISEKPFVIRYEASKQPSTLEEGQMELLLGGPFQKKNVITSKYVELIRSAKKEIKIANLYINPTDDIYDALLNAVNRGVKLSVISNGVTDISPDYTRYFGWANRLNYVPLLYGENFHFWDYFSVKDKAPNKTEIYEYYVKNVLLHKKVMIVDDKTSVIGSYNLGMKSHVSDYEMIMVIHSPEIVKKFNKIFQLDLTHSRRVTLDEAHDWYFDPVTSYIGTLQKRFGGLL